MQTKQIIVIAGVCLVMGGLLSMEIHKAGKPAEQNSRSAKTTSTGTNIQEISESDLIKNATKALSTSKKNELALLENEDKEGLKTAEFWKNAGKPGLEGLFEYKALAANVKQGSKADAKAWIAAGDAFRKALNGNSAFSAVTPLSGDSVQQAKEFSFYAGKAIESYQKAIAVDPSNLEAQTGLGVCYVTASENPMEGIGLLLGVIKKDPENLAANFNLGLFSMRSGQYDKAIARFKTVVSKENNGEAWFYLAQAYQQTGKKSLAVEAYQQSKKYISDSATRSSIDHLIQQTSIN